MSKKLSEEDFLFVIDKAPLASLDLVCFNRNNKILLGMRNNKPAQNYWFVPGGRILKNEALGIAFERIAFKELDIKAEIGDTKLMGVFDHFYEDNVFGKEGIDTHYISIAFELSLDCDQELSHDNQHKNMKWFTLEELLQSDSVHKNTKKFFTQ